MTEQQQQFKKQTAKEGYQQANAEFKGLLEQPKVGETNGQKWRKAKVSFQIEGKQIPNKFIIWTPLKEEFSKYLSDEKLEQFKKYKIGWYESDVNINGKEWVVKKIVNLDDPSETIANSQSNQQQQAPAQAVSSSIDMSKFDELSAKYVEQAKNNKDMQSAVRLMGWYLVATDREKYKELYNKCCDALGLGQQKI